MAKIKGICKNIDECSKAEHREIQEVEKSASFVCEECGKPLTAYKQKESSGKSKLTLILVACFVVIVLGIGSYFMYSGYLSGGEMNNEEATDRQATDITPDATLPGNPDEPKPYVVIDTGDSGEGNGAGSISFQYGKYEGEIKKFKANGQGRLTYYKVHKLTANDPQNRETAPGDVFDGIFVDNEPANGKWFDKDKNQKGTVLTGQTGNRD